MPPKKKSNKDDNDILTRIAIVNADRSACYGPEALNASSQTAHLTPCDSCPDANRRNAGRNARKVARW